MSTSEPHPSPPPTRRNPWIWVSLLLAVIAAGLLVWGLNTRSDLDAAQQEVDDLQAQIDQGKKAGGAAAASYQAAYDDLQKQLGTTSADLSATEQDLEEAEQAAARAEQQATDAEQQAADATNATDKANAEAAKAKADAQAAESRTAIVTGCANAYVTALGSLVQSDEPKHQAAAARQDLETIAGTCSSALGGK